MVTPELNQGDPGKSVYAGPEFEADRRAVRSIEAGDALLEYLRGKYNWKFSGIMETKKLPEPPAEILSMFSEEESNDLAYLVHFYEKCFIMQDQFASDHDLRRDFETHILGDSHNQWLGGQSKLGGNNQFGCFLAMDGILRVLQKGNVIIDFDQSKISWIRTDMPAYNTTMDNAQKLVHIQEIDAVIEKFFLALSQASVQQR